MSFLSDFLSDLLTDVLFGSAGGDPSPRRLLMFCLAFGLALCAANAFLVATASDPLREPASGFVAIACTFMFGGAVVILCTIHLSREQNDRGLASVTLLTHGAAILLAIAALIGRKQDLSFPASERRRFSRVGIAHLISSAGWIPLC